MKLTKKHTTFLGIAGVAGLAYDFLVHKKKSAPAQKAEPAVEPGGEAVSGYGSLGGSSLGSLGSCGFGSLC